MSYELTVAATKVPSWRGLRDAILLEDVRVVPFEPKDDAWPTGGLQLCRVGRSTRTTTVTCDAGKITVAVRALASPEDCELALCVAEAAARLAGVETVETDYFEAVDLGELRRLHTADWMREQAESGTRALAHLIREGRGPMGMPGPIRSTYIGVRLLAELEAAGRPEALFERVLARMRSVQWDVPGEYRDAGVFESRGGADRKGRETHFAVWLPDENLVMPFVDFVGLRVVEGEVLMVPFAEVAGLAGANGVWLDECQLLLRTMSATDWKALVERARPLAVSRKSLAG